MRGAILLSLMLLATPVQADWFRGNTHTHTSESDGDSSPADVAQWYATHGYQFLVITDHDKVTRLENAPLLLIPGEEITNIFGKLPVHVNAIGIEKAIPPQTGATITEVLQRSLDAVKEGGGLSLVNHPNFRWAFGSDVMLQLKGIVLLEIASGHPYVNMYGPPPVEQMWDDLLTAGRRVWGVAVDDSHHLKNIWDVYIAPPGKAWIVVRAARLDQESILSSITRGDFYASTGVEIAAYEVIGNTLTVSIKEKNGAHYRTQFIGAKGRVLAESKDAKSTFTLRRNSSYVRVKITDSNGRAAWLQPHFRR
jgi:hypothetical protein